MSSAPAQEECDGVVYVELNGIWEELFCWVRAGKFQAYRRQQVVSVDRRAANKNQKRESVLEFLCGGKCEARPVDLSMTAVKAITTKSATMPKNSVFMDVVTREGRKYLMSVKEERERQVWVEVICYAGPPKMSNMWKSGLSMGNISGGASSAGMGGGESKDPGEEGDPKPRSAVTSQKDLMLEDTTDADDDLDENEAYCCKNNSFFRLKVDTFVRLLKVISSFPFVIVVATLNLSAQYSFLSSIGMIRVLNLLIYLIPIVVVNSLLSQTPSLFLQRLVLGIYIGVYLFPVGYVVLRKLKASSSTSSIEEGTFCFRPARKIRRTIPNIFAIGGFVMELVQHSLYCFPLGIVAKETADASTVSDSPPYIPFLFYFWFSVASVFICGLIIVLNAVLRGKKHYKFQNFGLLWLFLFAVGGPGFVTVVTILFMSLWCDYSGSSPVLVQDREVVCWEAAHTRMAVVGLIALAIYLVQMTLLPSGTYKETMRNDQLDIMFVPVYLQAHFFLKAVFCGIYVTFYDDDWARVVLLTFINVLLLGLMCWMQPCSVQFINVARQTFFICAVVSGCQSINYVANMKISQAEESATIKALFISTLATNMFFIFISMALYYFYTTRSTKFLIARTFLDLEWQVSKGGSVHPRVLEPLISLTLSTDRDDEAIAKNYIGQLVWLISYPNMRVQFQSAWGLANLALVDEDARKKIHDAGGTKSLFEWYTDMDFIVQLESLAALVNLTLSYSVTDDMVARYKVIPFFVNLISKNKLKHAQFAAIGIANIARTESYREDIRKCGGIPMLVGCIMSSDYGKKRFGALALANMALSPSYEIVQAFHSKKLMDKIIKMAVRKELETQREVTALIRNLSCHEELKPLLLERGVIRAIAASKSSVYPEVVEWGEEIARQMEETIARKKSDYVSNNNPMTSNKVTGFKSRDVALSMSQSGLELLARMTPLEGCVTWSTWGSKLESIFAPIFASLPSLQGSQINTLINTPVEIWLANGLSKASLQSSRGSLTYVIVGKNYTRCYCTITYKNDIYVIYYMYKYSLLSVYRSVLYCYKFTH
jgi:hypothetical protein